MIDYHIHTSLCNHAYGTMADYVISAVKKGLIEVCFLDHLILSGPGKKSSMGIDEIPAYYTEIERLKTDYADKIKIKAGLEIDFDPANISRIEEILSRYSFDAIGGSVHFIDGINIASRREAAKATSMSEAYLTGKYFETLYDMLDHDFFDFICHFDIIKKTGRKIATDFTPIIDAIIKKTALKNKAVEINTAGWSHPAKECYPSFGIIEKCVNAQIPFVLSSDAHRAADVGNNFYKALNILSSFGCCQISSYKNRERKAVNFTKR